MSAAMSTRDDQYKLGRVQWAVRRCAVYGTEEFRAQSVALSQETILNQLTVCMHSFFDLLI